MLEDNLAERVMRASFWVAIIYMVVGYLLGKVLSAFIEVDQDLWNGWLVIFCLGGAVTGGLKAYFTCQIEQPIWYIAHVIMRDKDSKSIHVRVWENMLLVSAKNDDEAYGKAEKYGKEDANIGPALAKPIHWEFVGVRKLVRTGLDSFLDGAEVSCNELLFEPYSDVDGFALGDGAEAEYVQVNVLDQEPPKYWLAWYEKTKGISIVSVGEVVLKSVCDAEIRHAFGLKPNEYADNLHVGQDQINWLKSKGYEVDLDKYDYFVEIMAP